MGWSGYGLYDGDETQTCHLDFIKTASNVSFDISFEWLGIKKTKIPSRYVKDFVHGVPLILKKIRAPKNIFKWNEDNAIEWQMLLSLFVDNNLIVPHKVLVYGILACHYFLGDHASEFDEPTLRRSAVRRFMKKVNNGFCSVKARQEISRKLQRHP